MELSVRQEHLLNVILAKLFRTSPDETRSFGTTNQALNFHAKANLLFDLNYLDKNQREKFQIFMEIRNKFAHLHEIDTFEKCFSMLGNYNRLKKLFGIDEDGDSLEDDMETMFCVLSMEISTTLGQISEEISKDMRTRYTQKRWSEVIREKREEFKEKHPEHSEAVDKFIREMKDILLAEVDEKIKNNIPPHD